MNTALMLWLVCAAAVSALMMLGAVVVTRSLEAGRSIGKVEVTALVKAFGEKFGASKAEAGADLRTNRQKRADQDPDGHHRLDRRCRTGRLG